MDELVGVESVTVSRETYLQMKRDVRHARELQSRAETSLWEVRQRLQECQSRVTSSDYGYPTQVPPAPAAES
jgi:hypothetical protein